MHDVQRSGVTAMPLDPPLEPIWRVKVPRPAPAWTESPAVHDWAHKYYNLRPRQHFDRASEVVVAGSRVYFGSSVDGTVTCVDNADRGREIWRFETDGPVRFAPSVAEGRVYFGSDDGSVYCVTADAGKQVWRKRTGPREDRIWGNQHMISVWPVRTSVLVDKGYAYWTAGIFPEEGMFVSRCRADDGSEGWTVKADKPPQGYLLATSDRLFVPTGKTVPGIYARADGKRLGQVSGGREGGSWALVSPDKASFWFGPGIHGEFFGFHARTSVPLGKLAGARSLIVIGGHVYYATDTELVKVRREGLKEVWRRKQAYPNTLIYAGGRLFAGGNGGVAAFDGEGNKVWSAPVDGTAFGLAAADGSLFVSTDDGSIYSFK
jgi:outer membrane protein assembly factor BamB